MEGENSMQAKQETVTYGVTTFSRLVLPWNQAFLDDFAAAHQGVMAIHPFKKEVYWYESVNMACNFNNTKNGLMGKFDSPKTYVSPFLHCHSGRGECARDGGRVYQGYIWFHAAIFSNKLIAENLKYFPRPIKNNKGRTFENIDAAAEWIKAKGYSTASDGIIKRSIRKNIDGITKQSYGMKWSRV